MRLELGGLDFVYASTVTINSKLSVDAPPVRSQRPGVPGSDDDDDFTPGARKHTKPKKPSTVIPPIELARAGVLPGLGGIAPHTLAEHHDLFFSSSFPASGENSLLGSAGAGAGPSSSAFDFGNDGFFGADGGDLGLDLELDLGLGEDWGALPAGAGGDAMRYVYLSICYLRF